MPLFRVPRLALVAIGALLSLACGPDPIPNLPVGDVTPPTTRPADGLLENPALQAVVDLQVNRDGAGLRALLGDTDPSVRARAAFALASVQDEEAGSALVGLLGDPDPRVRRDAAFALGQLPTTDYGPSLLGALRREEEPDVRGRLLEALGKAGDARILEGLLGLDLPESELAARNLAVARLGINGFTLPTSVDYLVRSLQGGPAEAQTNAAYYFGRSADPTPWASASNSVRVVLDSLPPDDPMAMHLILGLALLGDPGDNGRLLAWVKGSPDWRNRASAARGLMGRTDDVRVREGLLSSLADPSTHVGVSAAGTMAGVQQLQGAEREELMDWVEAHPENWRVAGPLLATLGRVGEGDFLREWLDRWPEEAVVPRTRGIGALAFVGNPSATDWLMEFAGSDQSRIRGTALGGLARRWRVERRDDATTLRYFHAFAEGLRTGDPAAGFVAAPALADSVFLPLGALDVLMNQYRALVLPDDLETKQAILRSLGATGTPEGREFLENVTATETGALQRTAATALAEMSGEEEDLKAGSGESGRTVDWAALGELGPRPRLVLETAKGTVTLVLDTESAPLTVQTIAGFVQEGLFDDTPFHRVVPNFVVQGGDFARQDGFGGPGFSIRSEFTQISYQRGVLGMASAGKDTEGSQFFIMHSMAPHLDGGYTAFGWVDSGMDVVDRLYEEDRIISARMETGGA